MTRRARRLTELVLLVLLTATVSGCVGMPEAGPVRTEPAEELLEQDAPVDFTPGGPRAGASPLEVARGFLVAMQATPLSTTVARQFLTARSSSKWVPEQGTLIYTDELRTEVEEGVVRLDLTSTAALDRRGSWLGETGDQRLRLKMVRENGEWRISNPPDRLMVPLTHFQSRYFQYNLYFFDKAAEILVPEPVHVPGGAQATTALVTGLLQGPGRRLLGVERTFLPARTVLDDISVPVSNGTADVPLSDDVLDLEGEALELAFAQLAATLGQVPGVDRFRVTVDGSPLEVPGMVADMPVTGWSELSPDVPDATQSMFGVRDGRVVAVVAGEERPLTGVFGAFDLGVEKVGVDLPGERVAATTADGELLVGPRARDTGVAPVEEDAVSFLFGGTDLLAPTWDLHGNVWVVDRTRGGAVVSVVRGDTVTQLDVEGISGEDVRSFTLSRDGTRLVAEVAGEESDLLEVSRVLRNDAGRVRGMLPADPIPLSDLGVRRVRDVEFRTPTSVAVLTGPVEGRSRVLLVDVDGSTAHTGVTSEAGAFEGEARALVTSPSLGAGLFVHTSKERLFVLAASGRWAPVDLEPGLKAPTFVG